jgi:predicted amidohydrolase YtcJ
MSDTPSIIFINGSIHTIDADNSVAEAIAIQGDRILLVGSNTDIRAQARSATQIIDLAGRTVTPGFIDAHQHFAGIGASQDAIDCKAPGMNSIAALVEEVRKKVAIQPEGTWIRGRGYNDSKLAENRHPNTMDWDAVAPNHPVWFTRTCGHIGSFNSAAMQLAEVEATLSDPDGGRFDRNSAGEIIGVAYERATVPFRDVLQPSKIEIKEHLRNANRLDLASGLTSIHDAGGMTGLPLEQALDLVATDELQVRIYSFVTVNALDHPHVPILETGIKTGFGNQQIRVGAFKIMTDGSSSGPTAATRAPYSIDSDNSGIAYWGQNDLDDLLGRAHRAGWQCTVHAVGDKAIEQTLDAMARAQAEYPRDALRHTRSSRISNGCPGDATCIFLGVR